MVPIDFGDTLTVRPAREPGLRIVPRGAAPVRGNTVLRALRALKKRAGLKRSVRVTLRKRVPPGSGLGGGSSDAAAVLLAVNDLFRLRAAPEVLHLAARDVGSDVPFFLLDSPALAAGRGELLAPLPRRGPLHFAVAIPPLPVSTAAVYSICSRFLTRNPRSVIHFLNTWRNAGRRSIGNALYNALERPAAETTPEMHTWTRALRRAGLAGRMSGSGSALYGLCGTRREAERAARALRSEVPGTCLAASSL
jgi:4-diphosphocytidyl-2-C-methyl-D-erythritol kinase